MRFSLRDLFWLTLVAALLFASWRHSTEKVNTLIRENDKLQQRVLAADHRLQASQAEAKALEALYGNARDQLTREWRERNSAMPR